MQIGDDVLKRLQEQVTKNLLKDHHLQSCFLLVGRDGGVAEVIPWRYKTEDEKYQIIDAVRDRVAKHGYPMAVTISEAWSVKYTDPATSRAAIEGQFPPPSQMPTRIEMAMIGVQSRTSIRTCFATINRVRPNDDSSEVVSVGRWTEIGGAAAVAAALYPEQARRAEEQIKREAANTPKQSN